ncbi:hypothetical protein [Neisseria shayeganii]|uniref:Calcium-binding protein n=1 Tax=Neisseria shayeganii TaxID=607712 RepID=A0A7D7RW28_9NEIS|nr:hypothetical protein [Neisseria shayeganii]QMT41304.1 hypothetical protein H3L94_04570 [Neisseria shayeganii]
MSTIPSFQQLWAMYLFEKIQAPKGAEFLDEKLIRNNLLDTKDKSKTDVKSDIVQISAHEFMSKGPGRFVNGAIFGFVKNFFSVNLLSDIQKDNDLVDIGLTTDFLLKHGGKEPDKNGDLVFDLKEIIALNERYLGVSKGSPTLQKAVFQRQFFPDGESSYDFAQRVQMFESTNFQVGAVDVGNDVDLNSVYDNNVRFVVKADGTRLIENFVVSPKGVDNFDFVGGNNDGGQKTGNLFNAFVSDPSSIRKNADQPLKTLGIGRTVPIHYTDYHLLPRSTYTLADFKKDQKILLDNNYIEASNILMDIRLGNVLYGSRIMYSEMYEQGVISFKDDKGRSVYYGTVDDDKLDLDKFSIQDFSDFINHQLITSVPKSDSESLIDIEVARLNNFKLGINNKNKITFVAGGGDDVIYGLDKAGGLLFPDKRLNDDRIFGGSGNDKLYGRRGDDYLNGGDDNDELHGEAGHDYLEGGSGQDTYHIQDHDTVFDSDGQGRIVFSGRERLLGADSADYTAARFARSSSDPDNTWYSIGQDGKRDGELVAERQEEDLLLSRQGGDSATVKGFFASVGSAQPGTFSALGITLADEVPAEGGSEAAFSQSGHAGRYNVFYLGGHHHFQISGAEKDDIVFATGTAGAKINGGSGSDLVFGSFHADTIYGGEDNDILSGSAYVGAGSSRTPEEQALDADTIIGGGGRDLISGMAGDDIIHTGFENEHLRTGSGGERGDWATGGLGNDRIYGSINHDFLSGAEGMDWLYGGAGDDVLIGDAFYRAGRRSQHIYVESTISGPTYLPGGGVIPPSVHRPALGTEFSFRNGEWEATTLNSVTRTHPDTDEWSVAINRETGDYALTAKVLPSNEDHRVAADGATDFLDGGYGNDLLIGQDGGDYLYGGHGDDILWGDDNRNHDVAGHDYLSGGEGNDVLHGGKGNDVLIGGRGGDRLLGGEGADVYLFHSGDLQNAADTDTISDSDGQGAIMIDGRALHTLSWAADPAQPDRWQAKETGWLLTRSGNSLNLNGGDLFQSGIVIDNHRAGDFGLYLPDAAAPKDPEQPDSPKPDDGGAATTPDAPKGKYETPEQTWSGGEDGDTLTGTDAREDLNGYGGHDTIFGMGGNDVINGGEGNDVLNGGAGADTYVFSGRWGQDTIQAEGGEDHIYFKDTKLVEVGFKREGKDLWIRKHGSSDSILIQNQFADGQSQTAQAVVNWEFADGQILKPDQVQALLADSASGLVHAMAAFGAGSGGVAAPLAATQNQPLLAATPLA